MGTITELLQALSTKAGAVSSADLVSELNSSKEGILKQLVREKQKKNVSGSSQEGWLITDKGRGELEGGEVHPTMLDEAVTPRQQFEAKGRLIGIPEDRIRLATDIVWSGDYNDINWVWEALGQADIADDLRTVWVNAWRAKLHKAIPPELETELTGVSKTEEEKGGGSSKPGGRDYIIVEDEPVRVGENLGDYGLQDAKDILAIRALRSRFSGVGQPGVGQLGVTGTGASEKVSEVLTALSPYLNKGSDIEQLKEVLADKLALQRQEILSQIPTPAQPSQPKSFIQQVTEAVAALGSLKEVGPMIRSILGVPDSSDNMAGNPASPMDERLQWRKFLAEEKRADDRHKMLMGLGQTVRENVGDGISAIRAAAEDVKGSPGAKTKEPEKTPQVFKCGGCGVEFSPPPGWAGQPIKCPNPECPKEYTKEELEA